MKKTGLLLLVLLSVFFNQTGFADTAYLQRFLNYWQWQDNLSQTEPGSEFLQFIQSKGYLSDKLRNKWLNQLAEKKDWARFHAYYQPSEDINLQCHAQYAAWQHGQQHQALEQAKLLWLTGRAMPKACDPLFSLLKQSSPFNDELITERLELALAAGNIGLANYLLKQYSEPKTAEINTLNSIHQHPENIRTLTPSPLHEAFYLYGLKRLVRINMNKAVYYLQHVKTQKILSEEKQQQAIAQIALYKALRNEKDALFWFDKIKTEYYTDTLIDWEFRYALKRRDWPLVKHLLEKIKQKGEIKYKYWQARALTELGEKEKAHAIYKSIAKERNYYGFLASMQLGLAPQFEEQLPEKNMAALKDYQPVLELIKSTYADNHWLSASRLINDFASELPADERSAFAVWVANELKWYGKSVYLSSHDDLINQLQLRFPIAYHSIVRQHARKARLPDPLIFAMIRQESAFREQAVSSAGAKGLMQLMPETARLTAKSEKIPYHDSRELFNPKINIALGTAYMKKMAQAYQHQYVLMIAAYNAGPKQVRYWQKHHPQYPQDIWIETLPWRETRNYLKNVLAFYVVYQHRLGEKPGMETLLEQSKR